MSLRMLSDGQCVEALNISKVELYEEDQNLLVALKNGNLVGVHGDGVVKDANILEDVREIEHLTYPVYRKSKWSDEYRQSQDLPLDIEQLI